MYDENKKVKRGEIETLIRFSYCEWSGTVSLEGRLWKEVKYGYYKPLNNNNKKLIQVIIDSKPTTEMNGFIKILSLKEYRKIRKGDKRAQKIC